MKAPVGSSGPWHHVREMESRIELQRDDHAPQRIFRSTGIIYRVDKRYVNSCHHAALSVPGGQVPGFP